MSPVDEGTLERLRRAGGSIIDYDRPCRKCDYNLKGLVTGGRCPECGAEIRGAMLGRERPIGESPRLWLAGLRLGLGLAAIGSLGHSVLPVMVFWGMLGGGWLGYVVVGAPLGATWAIGVWLVARPRPAGTRASSAWSPGREWRELRLAARFGAVGVVGQMWLFAWYLDSGLGVALAGWYLASGAIVGSFALYAAMIAFWLPDENRAWGLRGATVLVGLTSALLATKALGVFGIAMVVSLLLFVVFLVHFGAMLYVTWCALRMRPMVRWAVRHADGAEAVEVRRRERAEAEAAQAAAARRGSAAIAAERVAMLERLERRHAEMEAEAAALGDARDGPGADVPRPGRARDRVIPKSEETYGLEEDA
jgi:hypothetical protein